MPVQWIVLMALLAIPAFTEASSEKVGSRAPKIRPERKAGEKPKGKRYFVQVDWSAARGTSVDKVTSNVEIYEGESLDLGGTVSVSETDQGDETCASRPEVGIVHVNGNKIQLKIGSTIKRSATSGGVSRQTESHRVQLVETVLDKPVKV